MCIEINDYMAIQEITSFPMYLLELNFLVCAAPPLEFIIKAACAHSLEGTLLAVIIVFC